MNLFSSKQTSSITGKSQKRRDSPAFQQCFGTHKWTNWKFLDQSTTIMLLETPDHSTFGPIIKGFQELTPGDRGLEPILCTLLILPGASWLTTVTVFD